MFKCRIYFLTQDKNSYFITECGIASVPKWKRKTTPLQSRRIEGGAEVSPHSIPWQVDIVEKGKGVCGGTLISSVHVLTAAHCVVFALNGSLDDDWKVSVGQHKRSPRDGKEIEVCHISVFNGTSYWDALDGDYAIVLLSSHVMMSNKVSIACLPDESMGGDFLVGKILTVSGWGLGSWGKVLHGVQYPGQNNTFCQFLHKPYNITNNMLCAGNPFPNTKSHCRGDSGGKF